MNLIVSFWQGENGIAVCDIDGKIIELYPAKDLAIDPNDIGIRSITYNDENLYYATFSHVVKTKLGDLMAKEVIYNGVNIHGIDLSYDSDDALLVCNSGFNYVVRIETEDDRVVHIGMDGMRSDFNHITTVYGTKNHNYFVYHNNWRTYGTVVRDDDIIILNMLVNPHNLYLSKDKDIIITNNSLYNEVYIGKLSDGDQYNIDNALEVKGYTRGMALTENNTLFVGESRTGKPAIDIIDISDKQVIDRFELKLDEEHEIYDIRILNDIDLCMSRSNRIG